MTTDDKNQKQNQISKQETPEEMMRKQQWRAECQKQRDMEQEKKRQEEQAYLRQVKQEMIDDDLFEPLTHEEMIDIMKKERQQGRKKKTPLTLSKDMKLIGMLLALVVLIQGLALVFQTFNIPAIEFVKTSIALSFDEEVEQIKDTVVVIDNGDGRGTGFLISPDGLIVTNAHVVDDETEVTVGIKDQDVTTGEVIKHIPEVDLAFVQVEGRDLPYLELSRQPVEAGESITFVGNPLRFNRIANTGTIIGETPATLETAVYALDAPVYKGNSGSPVVNVNGEVVAVIYATRESEAYGRVGLAIDVHTVQTWVDELAFGKQN